MFSLVASIFETGFMVLEPAYRTYKVLKSSSGLDNGSGNQSGNQIHSRPGNRPGFLMNGGPESEPGSVPVNEPINGPEDGFDPDDQADKKSDQRRLLLMHWIVYAAFQAVGCLTQPWLPFFSIISIVTVVWLRCGGTEIVYQKLVEPFLSEHEQAIDQVIDKFDQTKNTVTTVTEMTLQLVTEDSDADAEPFPAVSEPQLVSPVV